MRFNSVIFVKNSCNRNNNNGKQKVYPKTGKEGLPDFLDWCHIIIIINLFQTGLYHVAST